MEDVVVGEDAGVVVVERTEVVSEAAAAGGGSEVEAVGADEDTIRIINPASW
jgi:hypothetical protein